MTTKHKKQPKERTARATPKQAEAIRGVLLEKKSVRRAMIDAGYSVNTADNAAVLTQSKAFLETMDNLGLSDTEVVSRHRELMHSTNESVSMKAVDTAYKVKGKYDHTRTSSTGSAPILIQINVPNDPQEVE